MKILLVNNFYYNRGGDCIYLFSLKKLLEKKGHKVIVFSMSHPENFQSDYSDYFVSYINYAEEVNNKSLVSGLRVINRSIYSSEARRNLERLIKKEKPDIAHIQNIYHHITPSTLYVLKNYKIPIIWTLHDFTIICPNTTLLYNGRICERCKKRKYFWPLIIKCKKKSLSASLMAAMETIVHRMMKIYNMVDIFIVPSNFTKYKLIEYGLKWDNIIVLNHFYDIDIRKAPDDIGYYYLYIGRISEEKGILTLIDAVIQIGTIELKIIGDGPLKEELISYAKSKDKNESIVFIGQKSREELIEFYMNCKAVIVPSICYETFGLVILEAFACGKPVIGSRLGPIPELIKDYETGLTFEPGNVDDLVLKIDYMINNPDKTIEMGKNARKFVETNLNAERHYQRLMEIYCQVKNY